MGDQILNPFEMPVRGDYLLLSADWYEAALGMSWTCFIPEGDRAYEGHKIVFGPKGILAPGKTFDYG